MWNMGFQQQKSFLHKRAKEKDQGVVVAGASWSLASKQTSSRNALQTPLMKQEMPMLISKDSPENTPVVLQKRKRPLTRCRSDLMPDQKKAFIAPIISPETDST